LEAIRSKFQKLFTIQSHEIQGDFRSDVVQIDFKGFFRGFSGGFLCVVRGISDEISDEFQSSFRGISDCFQEVFSTSQSDTLENVFRG